MAPKKLLTIFIKNLFFYILYNMLILLPFNAYKSGYMKQLHAKVYGKVQGVFFRANTETQAKNFGLTGWVRNLDDGGVEVVAEGDFSTLEKFLAWLYRGPAASRVDEVKFEYSAATCEFKNFSVRY